MSSTSQVAEALEVPNPVPDFLSGIVGDASLTPAEKSLMIEALFVHDAPEPPLRLPGSGAREQTAPAQRALARRRRARERVRAGLTWGATLGAGLVGVLVGRSRR
jgi:hypothetical protein